tara:strand:+ start:763 stop:1401 length:639 start_codon:yes stop_codon:yes gene_type:complete
LRFNLVRKFLASAQQFGLFNSIKIALRSRLKFIVFTQKFNIFYLAKTLPAKDANQSLIKSIEVIGFNGESTKMAIGRELVPNETLFLKRQDGKVLGHALTQEGGKYQLSYALNIKLPQNIILLKGLYVNISERGKGLGLALNYARILYFKNKSNIYTTTMSENSVAGKNLEKAGFEFCGQLDYVSFFGKTLRLKFFPNGTDSQIHAWWNNLK